MGRTPDFELTAWSRKTCRSTQAGVAWRCDDGTYLHKAQPTQVAERRLLLRVSKSRVAFRDFWTEK